MPRIGHACVSTLGQDLNDQVARLTAEGRKVARSEKVSGGSREGRAELATILAFLRPGDEFVITRLDRLATENADTRIRHPWLRVRFSHCDVMALDAGVRDVSTPKNGSGSARRSRPPDAGMRLLALYPSQF